MIYILWDLFFISLWDTQICVCRDDLQALVGFSSLSIADASLFFCYYGCVPSIKQAARTSYCDTQNRTKNATDSVQLNPILFIIPLVPSSQLITLLHISLKIKSQRDLSYLPSTKTTCAPVLCPPSVTISYHCSCLQITLPQVPAPPTQGLCPSKDPLPISSFLFYWIILINKQNIKPKTLPFTPNHCPEGLSCFPSSFCSQIPLKICP